MKAPGLALATAALLALFQLPALAAEDPQSFDLDELRVPASPAFTILGVSPTAVERPTSSRAFAFSALSAAERAGGSVPSNLAMEFTPYWWYDRPDLTLEGYYKAPLAQRVAQSLAVSVGSAELATYRNDDTLDGTALAVGVRANLLGGKPAPQLVAAVGKLRQAQLDLLDQCVPDLEDDATSGSTEIDLSSKECQKLAAALDAQSKAVSALNKERVGLVVDVALAAAREYPGNVTDDDQTSKYGAWLTWSYRSEAAAKANPDAQTYLVGVAVQRWLRDEINDADMVDIGGRLIYKSRADKWSVSAEYLKRFGDGDFDGDSARLEIEYVISERYTLVAAVGRDFETATDSSPLIAFAGLNVSLGRGPAERLSR